MTWRGAITCFALVATLTNELLATRAGAEKLETFVDIASVGGDVELVTKFTVQSGEELTKRVKWLHDKAILADYAIFSTADVLFLDEPLTISSAAGDVGFTVFFGVKNKPGQRLQLVCRNARTALIIRLSAALGNLDISNCTDSAIVVNATSGGEDTRLLFASLHHNRGRSGGAAQVNSGTLNIATVAMSHNEASASGGALYVGHSACIRFGDDVGRFTVAKGRPPRLTRDYFFMHNRAAMGGAMFLDRPTCKFTSPLRQELTIYIGYASFVNNTAQDAGGAVFMGNKDPSLEELARRDRAAVNEAVEVAFMFADFVNNQAVSGSGGAIHVEQIQSYFTLDDVLFGSNLAAAAGGAVWAASSLYGTLDISNSSFSGNQADPSALLLADPTAPAQGYGGALYVTGSLQTYFHAGVTFTNNSALREGGAVHCGLCAYLAVDGVTFQGNSASSGGGLCMDVLTSSLLVGTKFVGNAALCPAGSGGAVGANGSAADGSGGAGYTCGCGGGGGLCIKSTSTVGLSRNTFVRNRANTGGALYINQDDCLLPIKPTCDIRAVNQTFDSNTATAAAGAVYLSAPSKTTLPLASLTPTPGSITSKPGATFEAPHTPPCQSAAARHSAAFSPPPAKPLSAAARANMNTFSNNTIVPAAPGVPPGYGPDVAAPVACMLRSLTLAPWPSPQGQPPDTQPPHVITSNSQKFLLLLRSYDAFGQLVSLPPPQVAFTATATHAASGPGGAATADLAIIAPAEVMFNAELRCLELQDLSLYATHYTTYDLTIAAVASSRQAVATAVVAVQLRGCCVGEVEAGRGCRSCRADTARNLYSFNPQNQTCDRCPDDAQCLGGTLVPQDGFWHASPRSDQLHACPVYEACAAGGRVASLEAFQEDLLGSCGVVGLAPEAVVRYSRAQCRRGYGGNVCGNCQKDVPGGERWGRKGEVCATCAPRWRTFMAFVALKLCEGVFVAGLVLARMSMKQTATPYGTALRETVTGPVTVAATRALGPAQRIRRGAHRLSTLASTYLAALLEILIVHLQLLGLLAAAQIKWPVRLISYFSVLRPHEGSFVWMSPDCLLPEGANHVAFWRIVIITLSPGGTLLLLLVAAITARVIRDRNKPQHRTTPRALKHTAVIIIISSATYYYPAIVNSIMSIFTCMQLDLPGATFEGLPSIAASHRGWWKQDYDTRCFTGSHMVFAVAYGLPFLLLFAVGVPLFITYFLWRHRSRGMLSDAAFQAKFGYMYTDFRQRCWFWFCMRFWLLLALSAAIQGLSYYGALRQLITLALCLSLFLMLQLGFKPYESTLINYAYTVVLYTVLVTVFLAFVYASPFTASSHYGTMWAVMVINGGVIAAQLGIIALGLLAQRKKLLETARSAVSTASEGLLAKLKSATSTPLPDNKRAKGGDEPRPEPAQAAAGTAGEV